MFSHSSLRNLIHLGWPCSIQLHSLIPTLARNRWNPSWTQDICVCSKHYWKFGGVFIWSHQRPVTLRHRDALFPNVFPPPSPRKSTSSLHYAEQSSPRVVLSSGFTWSSKAHCPALQRHTAGPVFSHRKHGRSLDLSVFLFSFSHTCQLEEESKIGRASCRERV